MDTNRAIKMSILGDAPSGGFSSADYHEDELNIITLDKRSTQGRDVLASRERSVGPWEISTVMRAVTPSIQGLSTTRRKLNLSDLRNVAESFIVIEEQSNRAINDALSRAIVQSFSWSC